MAHRHGAGEIKASAARGARQLAVALKLGASRSEGPGATVSSLASRTHFGTRCGLVRVI